MLSKSVRLSFARWARFSLFSGLVLAAGVGLGSGSAWATILVAPANSSAGALSNKSSTTAYYPTVSLSNLDTQDSAVPSVPSFTASVASGSISTSDALHFVIYSDSTVAAGSGEKLLLMVGVANAGGNNPVPIAYYNATAGSSSLSQCGSSGACDLQSDTSASPYSSSYYYGVPYESGDQIQIGILLKDLCMSTSATNFCSGTDPDVASGTTVEKVSLLFYLVSFSTSKTQITPSSFYLSSTPTEGTLKEGPTTLTLSFQAQGSTISCPSASDLGNSYFPGDGQIYFNTNLFGLSLAGSGFAPAGFLVVPYTSSSSVNGSSTPADSLSSSILARVPTGLSDQPITGFINSTTAGRTYYQLRFGVRDLAGYVAFGSSPTTDNCGLSNVETADVRGFLKESQCFIATAAFRSMDAAPVAMLRQFRDEVLLQFGFGKKFVRWYYGWSPRAAEWLIDHPEFRYPVLLVLVPVQLIAWLCLKPLVLLSLIAAALAVVLVVRGRSSRFTKGASA